MSDEIIIHWLHRLDRKIDGLYALLEGRFRQAMASFSDAQDAIRAQTSVEGGVVTLLQTITGQLRAQANAGGATPEQLQTIIDQIHANTDVMSAAVVANTSADPNAPPQGADTPPDPTPAPTPAPTDAPTPTP